MTKRSMRLLMLLTVFVFWHSVNGQWQSLHLNQERTPLIGRGGHHHHHHQQKPKPTPKCHRKHETLKKCVSGVCGEKKCQDLWFRSFGCVSDCEFECVCRRGYYRDNNGACVLRLMCRKPRNFAKTSTPSLKFLH
uniref:TIL domain containing protein n=1 Tax=Rhipicephalus appendiculatus TaxID=34631 RepID=A0A131YRU4_RHIAP